MHPRRNILEEVLDALYTYREMHAVEPKYLLCHPTMLSNIRARTPASSQWGNPVDDGINGRIFGLLIEVDPHRFGPHEFRISSRTKRWPWVIPLALIHLVEADMELRKISAYEEGCIYPRT